MQVLEQEVRSLKTNMHVLRQDIEDVLHVSGARVRAEVEVAAGRKGDVGEGWGKRWG